MGYKSVRFEVSSWSQKVDNDGVLFVQIPAESNRGEGYCKLRLEWVPGSNPPVFVPSCMNMDCTGTCELIAETLPDGTEVFTCDCVGGLSARTATKGSAKKAPTKKKAKKTKR